jgi:nicotinate-nucleotide adenylyltransferase
MKLGIFGGTFDPPHLAHRILAAEFHHQLGLERVLWVLTPQPPHKDVLPIASVEDRLDMLRAAIADNPAFEISLVEVERPGPQYAVDTMQILADRLPQTELVYLMGGDSLRDLPTWKRPQGFLENCHGLGVIRRPGDQVDLSSLETLLPGIKSKLQFVDSPLLEISASDIRRRIAQADPYRYFLPEKVYRIIQERRIYR